MDLVLAWIGHWELIIILVIVMLLFGATQIPRLMRGVGQGVHEFKKGLDEGSKDEEKKDDEAVKDEKSEEKAEKSDS